jgi:hypothetical protein
LFEKLITQEQLASEKERDCEMLMIKVTSLENVLQKRGTQLQGQQDANLLLQ